jgi:SAM-dependent methyltransferase
MTESAWMHRIPDEPSRTVDLRTDVPHPARVYDFLLGGKDNFAADRAVAEASIKANPEVRSSAVENRGFLARATRYLVAEAGIRQFLDIGAGLPTSPNTHEVAQAIAPESRVIYVDHDPIVLTHGQALLTSKPEGKTAYLDGDLRDLDAILSSQAVRDTLDLSQPVGLLLLAVLHFVPDSDEPYAVVKRLIDWLPPGSYLMLSHLTPDFDPETWATIPAVLAKSGVIMRPRTRAEIEPFFDGLELIEPGVRVASRWRNDADPASLPSDAAVSVYGGLARKLAAGRGGGAVCLDHRETAGGALRLG